jgi:hypothetical protein
VPWVATLALCILAAACSHPVPELQIVGESFAVRRGEEAPATSPWFDGARLTLVAARGETLGIQIVHGDGGRVVLAVPGADVRGFTVSTVNVRRASTELYGRGSRGAGDYPDELVPEAAPASDPAYFEISVPPDAPVGPSYGVLVANGRPIVVELDISRVVLPPLPVGVWAEDDPRVLGSSMVLPTAAERECVQMFRDHGVLLAPAMPLAAWPVRAPLVGDSPYIPVELPTDPAAARAAVMAWIEATRGTGKVPFAIPIDEPHGAAARKRVRALAEAVRAAGGGPGRFVFAVTDEPHADYGDAIDLYVTLKPSLADAYPHWTYNGAPPRAGSMVVDSVPPGLRTWGWIGWRYRIPIWYVWQALYWEDRYNHRGLPPRPLDAHTDARTFDDGDDHGNLDGVLALPGCHPTLRLEALRRGLEDRALLELASRCNAGEAGKLAETLIPRALGDASDAAAWPFDEAVWEAARRRLIEVADCAIR